MSSDHPVPGVGQRPAEGGAPWPVGTPGPQQGQAWGQPAPAAPMPPQGFPLDEGASPEGPDGRRIREGVDAPPTAVEGDRRADDFGQPTHPGGPGLSAPGHSAPAPGHRPHPQAGGPHPGGTSVPHADEQLQANADPAQRAHLGNERHPNDNRTIGEVMGDLSRDISTLMRQEVELAKAEINQSAKNAGAGAGLLGGAGVAGHMVLLFISLALWWAIAHLLGDLPRFGWAFVIVASLWAIAAGVMAMLGKKKLQEVQGVPQTQQTVKEIPDALKGQEPQHTSMPPRPTPMHREENH